MFYNDHYPEEKKDEAGGEYLNQENAFIRYITQINPIRNIVDTEYLRRYRRRVIFSGHIKALAFINNPRIISLFHCQRNNLSLAEDAGLDQLADEIVFDNIDLCQISRGTGKLQEALITQRREFRETSEDTKKGFLNKMMLGQQREQEKLGFMLEG